MADERALSNVRKRRGVVRASITRLGNRLKDFEAASDRPDASSHATQLSTKLSALDEDFRALHLQLIDHISAEDVGELMKEQEILDGHDDNVTSLSIRLVLHVTIHCITS